MNWENDTRDFADVLNEWMRLNAYTNSAEAAECLGVSRATLHGWRFGRRCPFERTLRKLMTAIDRGYLPKG